MPQEAVLVAAILGAVIVLMILWFMLGLVATYVQAMLSGAPVDLFWLLAMRLRRTPVKLIVNTLIVSRKAGLHIGIDKWEAHHLAGGDVDELRAAVVAAYQGGLELGLLGVDETALPSKVAKDTALFDTLASHSLAGGRVRGLVEGLLAAKRAQIDLTIQEACSADLEMLGKQKGELREAVDYLAKAQEACAKARVRFNIGEWLKGFLNSKTVDELVVEKLNAREEERRAGGLGVPEGEDTTLGSILRRLAEHHQAGGRVGVVVEALLRAGYENPVAEMIDEACTLDQERAIVHQDHAIEEIARELKANA